MEKVEIGIYFFVIADVMFWRKFYRNVPWVSTNPMNFDQIADFDWRPWQPKG